MFNASVLSGALRAAAEARLRGDHGADVGTDGDPFGNGEDEGDDGTAHGGGSGGGGGSILSWVLGRPASSDAKWQVTGEKNVWCMAPCCVDDGRS